ncbi:MAG: hypothetical protein QME88_12440 [Actinomycetota bacterium]|nr:hypothetical protein [Actinomycetota bacterium]
MKRHCEVSIQHYLGKRSRESINAHLKRHCEAHEITFTRSRPYRRNDSCYVEQKNWTAVRKYVGYFRCEGEEQLPGVWLDGFV